MAFIYYNPNPLGNDTGDCVIRAISKALNQTWDKTYWDLCDQGYKMADWGDSNKVWDSYLRGCGFKRKVIPNTCPDCYTIKDFCNEHPYGIYISRNESKEMMLGHLQNVMDMAVDDKDRKAISRLMEQMRDN